MNLDVRDKLCVVIGGGKVGYRKITTLLSYDARVRLISPDLCAELELLVKKDKLDYLKKGFEAGDLAGAFLVFSASDSHLVQEQVATESRDRGIFFNSATDPDSCDFHLPAVVRRGLFQITISTGGGSPAFSSFIRKQIEGQFGNEYEYAVCLLAIIRQRVLAVSEKSAQNKIIFRALADSRMLDLIKIGDLIGLASLLKDILPNYLDVVGIMDEFEKEIFKDN